MFGYHPNDPYQCPRLHACPHLLGVSLERVVSAANWFREAELRQFHEVERLRDELSKQRQEIESLQAENEQLRRELKAIHRRAFQKHRQSPRAGDSSSTPADAEASGTAAASAAESTPKKRGAPVGHPGWYRPVPTHFDQILQVVPERCPACQVAVLLHPQLPTQDHVQEDIIDGRVQVVCYRHPAAACPVCGAAVEQAGPGELLGCPIGPVTKAMATFLHFDIGLTCRKVQAVCAGLTGMKFSAAAVIGFDQQATQRAEPLAADIAARLQFSVVVHADESYWSIDGDRAYVWFHGNEDLAHFHIDPSRAGDVSRKILGQKFDGVLVTDCYGGYEKHRAGAKQKCLAHLSRDAKEWRELVAADSQAADFFAAVIAWVKRACALDRQRPASGDWTMTQRAEVAWLRSELERFESMPIDHERARTLQNRLKKHHREWLVFLDHPAVSATNNLAERALRPLVILRKLTFGNRSQAGAERTSVLCTVIETAKRQGHRVLDFLKKLFAERPAKLLVELYAPP
jgi:transposase